MVKNQDKKTYSTPAVTVVEFQIEAGFQSSNFKIVQPATDVNGMNEQMQDGSTLNWNWHVN